MGGGGGATGTGADEAFCELGMSCVSGVECRVCSKTDFDWCRTSERSDGLMAPLRASRLGDTENAD